MTVIPGNRRLLKIFVIMPEIKSSELKRIFLYDQRQAKAPKKYQYFLIFKLNAEKYIKISNSFTDLFTLIFLNVYQKC